MEVWEGGMKDRRIYIAYGSNMHKGQMAFRCPSAVVIGKGILHGYRMMFRGAHRSGVATIERSDGSDLPVLLWEITPEDEKALDRYEGYPHLYRKETIPVFFEGKTLRAMAYVMNERYPYTVPSRGYESIIAEGYRDMGVPRRILDRAIKETMEAIYD